MHKQARQTAPSPVPEIDEHALHELLGRVVVDFGAALIAPLVLIGDRVSENDLKHRHLNDP